MRAARLGWPALLLAIVACGEKAVEDTATLCEGSGEPSLEIGTGGIDGFDAWDDGTVVTPDDSGSIRVELLTAGLDTTGQASVVIRMDVDGASDDALSSVDLQCPSEGPGWVAVLAPLPADGDELLITATATDEAGESASVGPMTLTLSGG